MKGPIVTISNCVIYETYGCPIKMQFGAESQVRNIRFSNLVLQDVTGPISIDRSDRARRNSAGSQTPQTGFLRNIAFEGIRASVVSEGGPFADIAFPPNYRPGETRQCIVLNGIGDALLEDISFHDVHVTYGGGGTAEEARREVPQLAGEYFEIGTPPAYGLFARNVRGLTLASVRFDVVKPDLRPAVVLHRAADVAIDGVSAQGNPEAKSMFRLVETEDALVTAPRVLTPAAVFLEVEGSQSRNIVIDGGDLSKAATPVTFEAGAEKGAVKLRG